MVLPMARPCLCRGMAVGNLQGVDGDIERRADREWAPFSPPCSSVQWYALSLVYSAHLAFPQRPCRRSLFSVVSPNPLQKATAYSCCKYITINSLTNEMNCTWIFYTVTNVLSILSSDKCLEYFKQWELLILLGDTLRTAQSCIMPTNSLQCHWQSGSCTKIERRNKRDQSSFAALSLR